MTGETDALAAIARRYERFAAVEAGGVSPLYEALALGVAGSPELLTFLEGVPDERRQPNLFLAAIRVVAGLPRDVVGLEAAVRMHAARVRTVMRSQTTQTNEPARCAVLLPVLARLGQPLALIEVGASAGLCLLPDRYSYDYGWHRVEPAPANPAGTPIFQCRANAATPMPAALPTIAWRMGLDLNPLDVGSAADMAWLEALVWPGQAERADRLRLAIAVARAKPPEVRRGNLLADLPALVALAPKAARLVVFHTAVLGYVAAQSDRDAFAGAVRRSGAVWISNELPSVYPEFARTAPPPPSPGQFLLAVDGQPVAWTGPHGQSIDWFGH